MISVAIDGPSGAGKSSLAKRLAKELGYLYVDTGAMYRAIGLYALRAGADPQDAAAVLALLPGIRIELAYVGGAQRVFLNGEDVSEAIRTEAVGMAASGVSAHQGVRDFLLELQRRLARTHDLLMDGRDIGTVILPNATVKIFLTASAEARAARRLAQVLADICRRDRQDTERAAAPLRQAPDAVLVDTSELDFEQSFQALKAIILARV